MAVEQLTLTEAQAAIANLWGTEWNTLAANMSSYGITPAEMASNEFLYQWSGGTVTPIYAKNGETILGYNFRATAQSNYPGFGNNSNTSIISRGSVSHAPATTIETVGTNAGKVKVSRLAGVGTKAVTAASKLAVPLTLASIGITLGKTIDEIAYNVNPDFWESMGLSTVNPQTWSSIAGGDDTLGGQFINALFGIDPNTGETQAYMDADALAYMSYCMYQAGFFDPQRPVDVLTEQQITDLGFDSPFEFTLNYTVLNPGDILTIPLVGYPSPANIQYRYRALNDKIYVALWHNNSSTTTSYIRFFKPNGSSATVETSYRGQSWTSSGVTWYNRNWKGVYYSFMNVNEQSQQNVYASTPTIYENDYHDLRINGTYVDVNHFLGYTLFSSETHHTNVGGLTGVGTQENATIPDYSNLSQSDILPYLQQTYPNMFANAIDYPVVQPDGTVLNHKYVPITLADTSNMTDTQPVSGEQKQSQPEVNPATATQTLIDLLTKVLQQPLTEPINDDLTPPDNPVDTGEGSSPIPVAPTGSASSLWKVYHPTQAQIDSFGSWLWSSAFVDQILKIFNDPMQAIIGLHKIYATPVDAGTATIKVGYLDSQVPSAYIEQQYVEIDCGTVNLYEQFGNVFDYEPFTNIQLYLPFIGIVPLNVADVMRSSINIKYGVDVLTGACLAMVEITRDGYGSVLYQYAGNCAVQYPISSGSYMGIVSSIISIAGGIAATVATGGGAAPIVLGAAGAAMNAHTNVQHSGSFSGNAGAMGGKIPYLIISRPQTKVARNFELMDGYPTNEYVLIGDCSGYIKAESAHVINVNATDEEINMISEALYNGIII